KRLVISTGGNEFGAADQGSRCADDGGTGCGIAAKTASGRKGERHRAAVGDLHGRLGKGCGRQREYHKNEIFRHSCSRIAIASGLSSNSCLRRSPICHTNRPGKKRTSRFVSMPRLSVLSFPNSAMLCI